VNESERRRRNWYVKKLLKLFAITRHGTHGDENFASTTDQMASRAVGQKDGQTASLSRPSTPSPEARTPLPFIDREQATPLLYSTPYPHPAPDVILAHTPPKASGCLTHPLTVFWTTRQTRPQWGKKIMRLWFTSDHFEQTISLKKCGLPRQVAECFQPVSTSKQHMDIW
jgi:hypothetical protein